MGELEEKRERGELCVKGGRGEREIEGRLEDE